MSLLKKIAPLIAAGALAFASPAFSQEAVTEEVKKAPVLIGSSYGEISVTRGDIGIENPKFMNLFVGFNPSHKQRGKEVFLFPNLRVRLKGDRIENPWSNKVEIALGIEYLNGPLMVGIDGGYVKGFYGLEKEGFFGRVWSYYWNRWSAKNLSKSELFPMRPQFILTNDLELTTLSENLEDVVRLEAGMIFFEKGKLNLLAYGACNIDGNTGNFPWTNYIRGTGGIRAERTPFFAFLEGGYQQSLNGGNSGTIFIGGASMWLGINK